MEPTPQSTPPTAEPTPETPGRAAVDALTALRRRILDQMIEYIVAHADDMAVFDPDERYNFWLQELDDRFLAKLAVIRRAATELQTLTAPTGGTVQSRVKHVRIGRDEPLGDAIAKAVDELGAVTIGDIALREDADGVDLIVVYHITQRPRQPRKSTH